MDGFWTSSSPAISMAFDKKMMGFTSDLVSFSTKLMAKRHEKSPVTFFAGHGHNLSIFSIVEKV